MEDLLSNYQSQDMGWGTGSHDGNASEDFVTQSQVQPLGEDMYHVVPSSRASEGNGSQSLMERATEMARRMVATEPHNGSLQGPAGLGMGHQQPNPCAAAVGSVHQHGGPCYGGFSFVVGLMLAKEEVLHQLPPTVCQMLPHQCHVPRCQQVDGMCPCRPLWACHRSDLGQRTSVPQPSPLLACHSCPLVEHATPCPLGQPVILRPNSSPCMPLWQVSRV